MKHPCLKCAPIWGDETKTKWEHDDDPCSCECKYCLEYNRLRSLPEVSDEEMEKLWQDCVSGWTPGPWRATQFKNFGPNNYIVSTHKEAEQFMVVAELENVGNDSGMDLLAWCHDGIPRLLKTIEALQKELQRCGSTK